MITFGHYNFGAPKPWLKLKKNAYALDISEAEIEQEVAPYKEAILNEQNKKQNTEWIREEADHCIREFL